MMMSCTMPDLLIFQRWNPALILNSLWPATSYTSTLVRPRWMNSKDIPKQVWDEAITEAGQEEVVHHHMNVIWSHLAEKKTVEGKLCFRLLAKVARTVLILPTQMLKKSGCSLWWWRTRPHSIPTWPWMVLWHQSWPGSWPAQNLMPPATSSPPLARCWKKPGRQQRCITRLIHPETTDQICYDNYCQ